MPTESQESRGQSSCFPNKPVVGKGKKVPIGQLVSNSTEDSTGPLGNFLVFGKKSRFEYLKKEKAHIILLSHFLDDKVNLTKPLFHESFNLAEVSLDPFDKNMGKIFVVVLEQGDGLSPYVFLIFLL